ncbi:hypothetical protein C8R44DRAFT_692833 [Mycena epipterygia]|nr:hypothetical protein C8R44DRAFT_692833 [Mycena epipterygia]
MKLTIGQIIKDQYKKQPLVAKADLTSKTVIVVGANTGLGFDAAKHFARMNPGRLILACRSESKGQAAMDKLKADTGYTNSELWIIDLADFASVSRFADKFDEDGGRLDILVENAGITTAKYEATKDGWESSLQINCLSTPLLGLLLLPHMLRTAQQYSTLPRLVVVASEMHYFTTITNDLLDKGNILATIGSAEYSTPKAMGNRYSLTKLLNVFFVRALSEHLRTAPLIVNSVNPGFCKSDLGRDASLAVTAIFSIARAILAFTAEEGSRRLVWGAVGQPANPDALRGQYLNQCRVEEPSDFVISPEGQRAQEQIWDEMVVLLGKVDPRVLTIVDKYLSSAR